MMYFIGGGVNMVHYKGYVIEQRGRSWFWYLLGDELDGSKYGVSVSHCKGLIDEML